MFKFRSFVLHLSDRKIRPASKTGAPARAVGRVGGHVVALHVNPDSFQLSRL